jgi:hypothetical protein
MTYFPCVIGLPELEKNISSRRKVQADLICIKTAARNFYFFVWRSNAV